MSVTPKCVAEPVEVLKAICSLPGIQKVAQSSSLSLKNTYSARLAWLDIQIPYFLRGNDAEA